MERHQLSVTYGKALIELYPSPVHSVTATRGGLLLVKYSIIKERLVIAPSLVLTNHTSKLFPISLP
jgi:hypothetical protein